jgi:hypothetical protein
MESGIWRGVFDRALAEFNQLARQHRLGVTLTPSAERPAPRGRAGADVMVSTTASQGLHGHAQHAIYVLGSVRRVLKCFVTVPNAPHRQNPSGGRTPTGAEVCLCILVHEFVHCCGLTNDDHSPTTPSIFFSHQNVIAGSTPAEDRFDSFRYGSDDLPLGMPPIILDDGSAALVRQLWIPSAAQPASPPESEPQSRGPIGLDTRYAAFDTSSERPMLSPQQGQYRVPGPAGTVACA